MEQPARPLWRDRAFLLYGSGSAISLLGTAITSVALPIVVYRLTASALLTSLLATFEALPYLLFGLFAGEAADRLNRRRLMVGCDLLNALLLGSIPVALRLHALTVPQIFAVALLSATAFVWFDAADFGAISSLASRERMVAAASAISSISTIASIVGPALGGALIATVGSAPAFGADAVSYLLSAVSLLLIPRALGVAQAPQPDDSRPVITPRQTLANVWEGLRFLWDHRLVRVLTLLGFGLSFTGGAVIGLLVVYAVQALGLPSTDGRIGLLFAAGACGSFIASVLLPALTKRLPVGWISLFALSLNLLLLLALVWLTSWIWATGVYAAWELCYTLAVTNGRAVRQMVIPDHLQSRVNVYARMIAWGGSPFGAAVGGLLAQVTTTIRETYLLLAASVALSVVVGWFSPLRQRTMIADLAAQA
ncbi:MAG TPA: MFS transporter [Ktedonobacterales bacterium]|nr:MFS transporter [Ktedonobacterales bacterium]